MKQFVLIMFCALIMFVTVVSGCSKSSQGLSHIAGGESQNIGINNNNQATTLSFTVKATSGKSVSSHIVTHTGNKVINRTVVISDGNLRKYAIVVPAHSTVDLFCKSDYGCDWK